MRELLTFMQTKPENEALEIFRRIRSSGFEDLLRLIRQSRQEGSSSQSVLSTQTQGMGDQQRLPSIRTMLETSGPSKGHDQTRHGANTGRRRASISSEGSGASDGSSASGASGASNLSAPSLHSERSRG
jgi:hypothetical protein